MPDVLELGQASRRAWSQHKRNGNVCRSTVGTVGALATCVRVSQAPSSHQQHSQVRTSTDIRYHSTVQVRTCMHAITSADTGRYTSLADIVRPAEACRRIVHRLSLTDAAFGNTNI